MGVGDLKTKTSALKAQIPVIPLSNGSKFYQVRSDKHILAKSYRLFPLTALLALECGFILAGAILPLRGLWFQTALLTQLSNWVLLPTHILFPGRAIAPVLFNTSKLTPPATLQSWKETGVLLASFVLILLLYLLAIRYLPQRIT